MELGGGWSETPTKGFETSVCHFISFDSFLILVAFYTFFNTADATFYFIPVFTAVVLNVFYTYAHLPHTEASCRPLLSTLSFSSITAPTSIPPAILN